MTISKKRAIKLIDEQIYQFNFLLDQFNNGKMNWEEYINIYDQTENLIEELFSNDKKKDFMNNVAISNIPHGTGQIEKKKHYKNHLINCISQLKAYKTTMETFGEDDKLINRNVLNAKLQPVSTFGKKHGG